MNTIKQTYQTIEFINTFSPVARVLLALFALVPLLAPYELLIKPSWQGQVSFDWIIPLVISIGAVVVSLGLFVAALFGRGERFLFDASKRQLTYQFKTAFTAGFEQEIYSFDQIEALEIKVHEGDERPDTYDIAIKIAGGHEMKFGDFSSRSDAERYLTILQTMLANHEDRALRKRKSDETYPPHQWRAW